MLSYDHNWHTKACVPSTVANNGLLTWDAAAQDEMEALQRINTMFFLVGFLGFMAIFVIQFILMFAKVIQYCYEPVSLLFFRL